MLVLTRKKNETVVANGVVFRVLEVCGNKVRVGVEAPENVTIYRGEKVLQPEQLAGPQGAD